MRHSPNLRHRTEQPAGVRSGGLMIRLLMTLTLLAAMFLTPPAMAHAILEDSTPAAGATITSGPRDLQFRYNSRIDRARSRLTLTRPDHGRETVPILPEFGLPNSISPVSRGLSGTATNGGGGATTRRCSDGGGNGAGRVDATPTPIPR